VGDGGEVVDRGDAVDLGEQSLDEPEVAAGDARDGGDASGAPHLLYRTIVRGTAGCCAGGWVSCWPMSMACRWTWEATAELARYRRL
jgi:hypothetical protein